MHNTGVQHLIVKSVSKTAPPAAVKWELKWQSFFNPIVLIWKTCVFVLLS